MRNTGGFRFEPIAKLLFSATKSIIPIDIIALLFSSWLGFSRSSFSKFFFENLFEVLLETLPEL